ncbi:hypothetical protein AAC387_Pa05g2112 [Persea americana]
MESNGAFNPFHEYPRRELKEHDLISQLELGSRNDSEEVDCTLQLGLPSGNGGKRPRIDVPNNIHATPAPQNHGVANGQYGYYNMSLGNLGVSNMNWAPMNPNGGYYYGSSSAVAATVIPNGYNNAGMYPRTGEPDPRSVPNERVCVVCGSTSTPLWRNGPRGAKLSLCNACGNRFKEEERMANGYPYNGARARRAVPNGTGTPTNRA